MRVITIPDGKDPDEYIKAYGAERFRLLLDGAKNDIEYRLLSAKSGIDMETEDVTTRWGQRFLLLTGTSSIGKLELQIFGYTGEYGEYGWLDAENAATSGEINGVWAQGVGVWSHSNELNSDLLEAVLVSEDGENIYKVTMYHAATTDVENIVLETPATKFIQNGQIYIIKEGIKYDILGTEVK